MLKDLVEKNRSYRGYDHSVKISEDTLKELVGLARLTPSSINKQPLKYKLVWKEDEVDALQKETFWARALPEMTLPHAGEEPTAFIVICHDTSIMPDPNRFWKDVGITAQTMLLGAVEQGLGGIMIGNFSPSKVKELLCLPENIEPQLIVAFGKPDEEIVLTDVPESGSTDYYRDAADTHYVPKRALKDILL